MRIDLDEDRKLVQEFRLKKISSVTSIMSQRSFLNQSLGNIFYEAIRGLSKFLTIGITKVILIT